MAVWKPSGRPSPKNTMSGFITPRDPSANAKENVLQLYKTLKRVDHSYALSISTFVWVLQIQCNIDLSKFCSQIWIFQKRGLNSKRINIQVFIVNFMSILFKQSYRCNIIFCFQRLNRKETHQNWQDRQGIEVFSGEICLDGCHLLSLCVRKLYTTLWRKILK